MRFLRTSPHGRDFLKSAPEFSVEPAGKTLRCKWRLHSKQICFGQQYSESSNLFDITLRFVQNAKRRMGESLRRSGWQGQLTFSSCKNRSRLFGQTPPKESGTSCPSGVFLLL